VNPEKANPGKGLAFLGCYKQLRYLAGTVRLEILQLHDYQVRNPNLAVTIAVCIAGVGRAGI
jgi:hypothetical protein